MVTLQPWLHKVLPFRKRAKKREQRSQQALLPIVVVGSMAIPRPVLSQDEGLVHIPGVTAATTVTATAASRRSLTTGITTRASTVLVGS